MLLLDTYTSQPNYSYSLSDQSLVRDHIEPLLAYSSYKHRKLYNRLDWEKCHRYLRSRSPVENKLLTLSVLSKKKILTGSADIPLHFTWSA